jgi:hypothetical protein
VDLVQEKLILGLIPGKSFHELFHMFQSNGYRVPSLDFSLTFQKDNLCTGGLFHIINQVLSIPLGLVLVMGEAHCEPDFPNYLGNTDSAPSTGNFFVGILNKGGYLTAQDQPLIANVLFSPNMTFFSPNTAEALASFTKTATGLSQADLAAIFNYHIVPDFLGYSSVLETGMVLETVQGDNLTITKIGSDIFVNGAKIINPDFLVSNGVVHLIDSVLDRFNTTAPNQNATAAPSPTPKPASKHSPSVGAKAGIGVSVALAVIFLATFFVFLLRYLRQRKAPEGQRGIDERPSLLPCFGRRKPSERPVVPSEGSTLMRFLRKRTMSNRLSNTNGQYVRQLDSGGKASRVLGQDFELDANQIPNKAFEVSAVELDAGSFHGRPR